MPILRLQHFSTRGRQRVYKTPPPPSNSLIANFPMKECIDLIHELSFWPLPQTDCAFCTHRKCRRCREVSFSIAACCQCRTRAIERLKYLCARVDETDIRAG